MGAESKHLRRPGIRRDQVALTERRILIAAAKLFTARGYAGTSLLAVAEAASVSPRTVYVRFHSKAQLLNRCIETSVVGDQQPIALRDRDLARSGRDSATLDARLDAFVGMAQAIMERSAALFTVGAEAAALEPEIAALERLAMQHTLTDMGEFADRLAADGMAPAGTTAEALTDLLWVLAGPRTMVSLRNDRGWTSVQFATWLRSTLQAFLGDRGAGDLS
ncbi:MAG: TetR/AcrR family transcriptional regulator [Candidatus Dormibacteraeota bacterium]|nr:TetR/AcrR family transcriptional regulator [Candidatus Dormibacteraeota bacterium]